MPVDRILERIATVRGPQQRAPFRENPTDELVRQSRALGTMELIGTPEAAKLLRVLSGGAKLEYLTVEAAAAGERLRWRGVE